MAVASALEAGVSAFAPYAARAEFPIFERKINGQPLVYLDSAASAQKPGAVSDAIAGRMATSYANVHRGLHTLANETTEAYEAARRTVARFLNASSPSEIVFTKGGTEAINLVAATLGRSFQAGDEVVLTETAQAAGAMALIDGCQGAVHAAPDVQDIGADFYVFTGHKLFGPTGIGVLWGRADVLAELPPYQGGGEMIEQVTTDLVTYAEPPMRFEAGTPPILEAIGLGAAIDWLSQYDRDAVHAHERALYDRVIERINGDNGFRVIGQAPGTGAVLTFTVGGAHAHAIAQVLDRYGVAVRAGQHCAEPLMRRFGVTSAARASFALYFLLVVVVVFVVVFGKARKFFS